METPCVFLLPVMEVNLAEVRQLLISGLKSIGLSPEFVKLFPFEDIIATGLESHSERWTSLALRWAQQSEASARLRTALGILATNGRTQKLRHSAKKLLAR
jgi:hypothetical protein